ncbi:uncharacterized protein RCO7_07246 [Rhynchosporium graminicola]|uniref:Uncharacterized protein n=1 Tax=Rhynchosporium graminicola TaxID=2792576 RepID=A0A1E1L870_9HELO|nr:uncharacterized protein RCO7_07246 [Rhynchosporium commune]
MLRLSFIEVALVTVAFLPKAFRDILHRGANTGLWVSSTLVNYQDSVETTDSPHIFFPLSYQTAWRTKINLHVISAIRLTTISRVVEGYDSSKTTFLKERVLLEKRIAVKIRNIGDDVDITRLCYFVNGRLRMPY